MTGSATTRPPGWYPDPNDGNTQRYFDGARWTDQLAPLPAAKPPPWRWLITAVVGLGVAFVAFTLMQLAFSAAACGGALLFHENIGFTLSVVALGGIAAGLVGIVGTVIWAARR